MYIIVYCMCTLHILGKEKSTKKEVNRNEEGTKNLKQEKEHNGKGQYNLATNFSN